MIIGGFNGDAINSYEIFNIQTNQSCISGTLPFGFLGIVGGNLNGVPVFCGGHHQVFGAPQTSCYKFIKSWIPVNL